MLNIRQIFYFVVLVAEFGGSTFAANVTLAWNPNTNPTVAGYDIYYWVAKSTHTNKISAGNATSVTIANLQIGTTYDFAATTINTFGLESPRSAAISYTVPQSATAASLTNHPPTLNILTNL